MYGLASSLSAFGSLAGLRGSSTLFCICLACPLSARRVTGTVHRRVFCLVTGNAWEEPGKRTRVLFVSSPKLVRSPPSSTNSLRIGDLVLPHISTALKHPAATPVSHAFGWSEKSCQSRKSRDLRRLCPMGHDAIGQESLLCFSQKLDPQHPLQHHEPPPEPMKQ